MIELRLPRLTINPLFEKLAGKPAEEGERLLRRAFFFGVAVFIFVMVQPFIGIILTRLLGPVGRVGFLFAGVQLLLVALSPLYLLIATALTVSFVHQHINDEGWDEFADEHDVLPEKVVWVLFTVNGLRQRFPDALVFSLYTAAYLNGFLLIFFSPAVELFRLRVALLLALFILMSIALFFMLRMVGIACATAMTGRGAAIAVAVAINAVLMLLLTVSFGLLLSLDVLALALIGALVLIIIPITITFAAYRLASNNV